ncbi:MAG: DUF4199 domain-containing protein [Verrucomicrobia bacterium]|nr:DUF4199 domain-containing protein [Prolixibacteraceae bacterium]
MEEKSTFWKTAALYGLYMGIVLTLFSVILYVAGQSQNKALALITYPLLAIGIIMAQINYRDRELNGVVSYGQALGFGVAVMLFVGIITTLYNLIIFKIDPSLIEQAKIMQEEALLERGMSEEQIEASMAMTAKMMTPGWMAIMALFGSVLIGTIISLVTSIFVKRQPDMNAFDEAMEEVKTEE